MPDNNRTFPNWWWMIPILLLTSYLAARFLVHDVLWMDEWFSYHRSGGGPFEPNSIPTIIQKTIVFLSWPPGYFLSLAAWVNTFGGILLADRLFSLLLGLLTVSAMYRLGKRMHSESFGLIAALLLSTSVYFVYYLHEVRPYALYILAVTLSVWLYWELLKNPQAGRGIAWGFSLSLALSLYTHYIAALCVFSIALYHVLFERPQSLRKSKADTDIQRTNWIRILRLGINGCILYTPWVAVMLISVYNETLAERGESLPLMLYNIGFGFTNGMVWLLALLLLTLRWHKRREIRFIWLWIVVVMLLTILGNAYADFLFHPRHVLGILPMVLLAFAYALWMVAQWRREVAALLLGLWVGMGIIHSLAPLPFMERVPAHQVGIAKSANDTIVEVGETCIADDDLALYGLTPADIQRSFDVPLDNYLVNVEYTYNHVGAIVADVEFPSFLFPEAFYAQPPPERLQQATEHVDTVWVFSLPDVPIQGDLLALNKLLLDAEFSDCGAVVDRVDLLGTVYSRDARMCQQLVTSCGGN